MVRRCPSTSRPFSVLRVSSARPPPVKTKSLPWILLLCAAALGLRLWGLDWMLPQRMEPDAQVVVQTRILHDADREQAARYAADVNMLGQAVQMVTGGIKVTDYRPDDTDDEVDIRVRYPVAERNLERLNHLTVPTARGQVPISNCPNSCSSLGV